MRSGIAPRYSTAKVSPFPTARARISEATSAVNSTGEHAMRSTLILPASILERSRTSLMILSRCCPFLWIIPR